MKTKNNNNNISCKHNSIMKYVSNRVHAHIKLYKYNICMYQGKHKDQDVNQLNNRKNNNNSVVHIYINIR